MNDTFLLDLAQIQVSRYAHDHDDVVKRHEDAMECRDCEEWLRKGIDSFQWLQWAEKMLRQADYEGLSPFTADMQSAIFAMYDEWLAPCENARRWIGELRANGFLPEHVDEFEAACEVAGEIAQKRAYVDMASRTLSNSLSHEEW